MRIGISTTLVQGGRSEVGRYLLPLLAALLRHVPEHDYVLYALEDDLPWMEFAHGHARVVVVGSGPRSGTEDVKWHHLHLPALAREHRLDVLHIPTERRMLWRRPCALVTTIHHLGPVRRPRAPTSRGSCPGAIFRALAARQDGIVVGSRAASDELRRLTGIAAPDITVAPPGVDEARLGSPPRDLATAELIRRHGVHPPFFLVVGCLEDPASTHLPLIRAFDSFKTVTPSPWQLVFLAGGAANTQRLRVLARRSPYAADIHCVEGITVDELPLWYRAAGGLIHTPGDWGLATCVTESLAAGCPALISDVPAAHETFGDSVLYAAPDQVGALHHKLRELATDVMTWARLHAAGKARAANWDWKTAARKTADTYARSSTGAAAAIGQPDRWSGVAQPRV